MRVRRADVLVINYVTAGRAPLSREERLLRAL